MYCWCIYHIELLAGLILHMVETFGPADVLFIGSLGAGEDCRWRARFKRAGKQIMREVRSTSEKPQRDVDASRSSRHGFRGAEAKEAALHHLRRPPQAKD